MAGLVNSSQCGWILTWQNAVHGGEGRAGSIDGGNNDQHLLIVVDPVLGIFPHLVENQSNFYKSKT